MILRKISARETYSLRQQVLRPGQNLQSVRFPGDANPSAHHAGIFDGEELVGISTMHPENREDVEVSSQWRLRGMAVLSTHRGKGIGRQLLLHCIGHARSNDASMLWCNARTTAEAFYARDGFQPHGPEFDIPDVGMHRVYLLACT